MKAIEDILRESNALPALPSFVIELQKCLDEDHTGTGLLAEKISRDQVLAAKTLRLANSPFYSLQCTVGTIKQAVAVLGFDSVRTMATTAAIINAFVARQLPADFDFNGFWRHSLATGLCAKALARFFNADPDQAFMAGLLHDIGKLILVRAYPAKFMEAVRNAEAQQCSSSITEQTMFGFDHAAVGAQLARQWNFPFAIQEAIRGHEAPETSQEGNCLVAVVHVADAVVIAFGLAKLDLEEAPVQAFTNPVWGSMHEDDGILCQVAKDTRARVGEVCKSLLIH